jgi:hypothetical protein
MTLFWETLLTSSGPVIDDAIWEAYGGKATDISAGETSYPQHIVRKMLTIFYRQVLGREFLIL